MKRIFNKFYTFFHYLGVILTRKQKGLFLLVSFSSCINAMLQILGVALIAPVVSATLDGEKAMNSSWGKVLSSFVHFKSMREFIVVLCITICLTYIFKNIYSTFQLYVNSLYANKVQRELSVSLLQGYMKRDYDFFLSYGTKKVLRDVRDDSISVYQILNSFFVMMTETLTILLIFAYIVINDWKLAVCIAIISSLCILLVFGFFRRKMTKGGEEYRQSETDIYKTILQAVEGIKEVQVMRKEHFFVEKYRDAFIKKEKPSIVIAVGGGATAYAIEAIFVSGIMVFLCFETLSKGSLTSISLLASFMAGAVRMLPSLGRISSCINSVAANLPALRSVYQNIEILKRERHPKSCNDNHAKNCDGHFLFKTLEMRNICWHYENSEKYVLSGLNLTVANGESVGIVGASGAGKSTLADIILGLHSPQKGEVLLNDENIFEIPDFYSRVIGFVPQNIYLLDGTIAENIAFGVDKEKIDNNLVWKSLEQAQLSEFVKALDQDINTEIGERGIRLSGGQKQRIAIARALYRSPQILLLDEATSALDNETEAEVMSAIEGLFGTVTMIIIAHRLTTLKKCDKIYEINEGKAIIKEYTDIADFPLKI